MTAFVSRRYRSPFIAQLPLTRNRISLPLQLAYDIREIALLLLVLLKRNDNHPTCICIIFAGHLDRHPVSPRTNSSFNYRHTELPRDVRIIPKNFIRGARHFCRAPRGVQVAHPRRRRHRQQQPISPHTTRNPTIPTAAQMMMFVIAHLVFFFSLRRSELSSVRPRGRLRSPSRRRIKSQALLISDIRASRRRSPSRTPS